MVLPQHPHGFSGSTTPWGFASATGMGKECRGSRVAPYSATPESNEPNSLNLTSIAGMPYYNDRTHEELRLEDYELCKGFPGTTSQNDGSSFPIQNQGNAFQLSNSIFGPGPASVPPTPSSFGFNCGFICHQSNSFLSSRPVSSSQSSFGSLGGGDAFQQSNSFFGPGPASVPSSQSPSGSLSGPGTNPFRFPSGSLPEPASVPPSQSPFGSHSGPGTNPFRFPSGSPFDPEPASMPPSQSTFGSRSGPGTNPFRFPSGSVPEGPYFSAFKASTTPGFGITPAPFSWSTSPSFSSFLTGPVIKSITVAPGISNNQVSTTSGFSFSSTPAFEIQTSSGSMGTTAAKYQGSRGASYSATKEVKDNIYSAVILSISAMPSHKDKSHEELRFEDYELGNTGGQKLRNFSTSFVEAYNTPNQSSVHSPFSLFKSNSSEPNTEKFTPSTTISTAPTLFPSVNPSCCINVSSSQSQGFTPQPTTTSLCPTFTYPPSSIHFTEPIHERSCGCPHLSTTITSTSAPLSNQSSIRSPFQPINSRVSELKSGNFFTPINTISSAPTISPSVNPFCSSNAFPSQSQAFTLQPATASFMPTFSSSNTISSVPAISPSVNHFCSTNAFPSQSQAFTLQPATGSFMPTFSPNLNQPSLIHFPEPVLKNRCECSQIPTTFTSASAGAFSLATPSVIVSPSIQCTSLTASDPWPFTVKASQPQQTVENVVSLSTNGLNKPSQASSGLSAVEFPSQNIKEQQYVPSSTLSVESSLVGNPLAMQFPVDQPNAVTSRLHGISSLPVSNNISSNRSTSLLRIRHVSSGLRGSPTQKTNGRSSVTKVPFFINEEDRPLPAAPFVPRENPRVWVNISFPLCRRQDSKGDEVKDKSSAFEVNEDVSADRLKQHQDGVPARTEKRVDDVLALLPKLPDGDYYMEPSLHELAAKEMAEAGCCSHVKDFVVGRKSYGSIKFLGETDVRHLDIKSVVQFNEREIIMYPDERKKPQVGQELNKAAVVSILNVKCINKKTGEQYVEGHQVDRYQEILINKTLEQGAEFVSYDPVEGEWKFRVQHF